MVQQQYRVIYILPLAAFVFFLYALFSRSTIDLHLRDTYYVIPLLHASVPVMAYLFANAGVYFFGKGWFRHLGLTRAHVWLTIFGFVVFFYIHFRPMQVPRRYLDYSDYAAIQSETWLILTGFGLLLSALLCLILNFFISLKAKP